MTAIIGSPALRLLARRKLLGRLRAQVRRLRRPPSLVLACLGLLLFGAWIAGVLFSTHHDGESRDPEQLVPLVRLAGLFLTLFTVGSAMTHRGLFLPNEEIERLFSAPLSRSDIVRYRLVSNAGRSLFAGVLFGLILMRRMPAPGYAFAALVVALQTLPVVGQAAAILAGALEKRSVERLRGWPGGIVRILCLVLGLFVFFVLAFGGGRSAEIYGEVSSLLSPDRFQGLVEHPVVVAISLPFEPWARLVTAGDATSFAGWMLVCAALWLLFFEVTARLPIDFRELSLETSASISERIRRHRRVGGGASAAKVSRLTIGWRLPWIFGRGAGGAIAWRKTTAIVRKARGTLMVSIFVLAIVTLLVASVTDGGGQEAVLGGAALIVVAGTLYLAAGLRFDFREDLDLMDVIKAWPLSPYRIFAATILPQVLLISSMLVAGIVLRAFATQGYDPWLFAIVAAIPLFVFAWIALDNVVFLFAPVRIVPGQDGAMQNAGRAVVLMILRALLLGVVGIAVAAGFWIGSVVMQSLFGLEGAVPLVAGCGSAWLALLTCDVALVAAGGRLFRRFDVARHTG